MFLDKSDVNTDILINKELKKLQTQQELKLTTCEEL